MRFLVRYSPCLLIGLLVLGCGKSSFIKAKGRIVKGGQPYLTQEGEGLRIFFSPLEAPTGQQYDSFAAIYEPDNGSFQVVGKDGQGLPPGKYRVGLQLMKSKEDLLKGALLGKKSPFTLEVTGGSDDLVIDLDQAQFDTLLAQASAPKKGSKQ
jgi:hypothetical protein